MTANSPAAFLPRDIGHGHHHNSPAHLSSQRSFTSPQRQYPVHEEYLSSRCHTAPVVHNGSYQHVGNHGDEHRYHQDRRPSADRVHSTTDTGVADGLCLWEQPQSFPQASPHHRGETKPYSSLDSYDKDSGGNISPHRRDPRIGTPSSHLSAPPSYQNIHSQSSTPPSSLHHEKAHIHHHRAAAVSPQTRSRSDNSLGVPLNGPQQRENLRHAHSQATIPLPSSRSHPLTHSSGPPSSVCYPIDPDPLTAGGSSSAGPLNTRLSGHSPSPHHSPPAQDSLTTGVSKLPSTREQEPQTTGSPEHPTAAPQAERRRPSRRGCFSKATLENERYSLDDISRPDHDNEDRDFCRKESDYTVFGVFDGHDGSRASGFASTYMMSLFDMPSWRSVVENPNMDIVRQALGEFFRDTEREFFKSIQSTIDEKERLQRVIPQHLSSYAAYQQFPYQVSRLQELEPKLTGGCTAVLAILVKDRLYVANVGDSRALLVQEQPNGTLGIQQLTHDHSVESEEELRRLEALGLDPRELIKAGRLGMHENTRSIGDYSIKQGYKEVDILRSARAPPGSAVPYIMPTKAIDHTCKYLILMTDGVYKSIESTFEVKESIDSNKVLLSSLEHEIDNHEGNFSERSADGVLARVAKIHRDCYVTNSRRDPRSDRAVACRKRDDMTLLVYKFPDS